MASQINLGAFGKLDIEDWLRGLVGAFIGGGAGAISSGTYLMIQDPDHFNIHAFGKLIALMGGMFIFNGIIGAALFLHQKPMPGYKATTTTTTATTLKGPTSTTITTVDKVVTPLPKKDEP